MTTWVGRQSDRIALLRGLVELDFDAVEAYEAAIERIDDALVRKRLQEFCDDHVRHIAALNPVISELGGAPVESADLKRVLTTGKVVVGGLLGDRVVLLAMKSNEDDTNTAYERSVSHLGLSPDVAAMLRRHLEEERRHREFAEQALRALTSLSAGTRVSIGSLL